MDKAPKAGQEGRLYSKFIFNTVIPDFDPVSPALLGIGDFASRSKDERVKRGMTPFLNCYTCNSVMITIELRIITRD